MLRTFSSRILCPSTTYCDRYLRSAVNTSPPLGYQEQEYTVPDRQPIATLEERKAERGEHKTRPGSFQRGNYKQSTQADPIVLTTRSEVLTRLWCVGKSKRNYFKINIVVIHLCHALMMILKSPPQEARTSYFAYCVSLYKNRCITQNIKKNYTL